MTRRLLGTVLSVWAFGWCVWQAWAQSDPCLRFNTKNEFWRDPAEEAPLEYCDDSISGRWYTFIFGQERAIIPTVCMQDYTCGGHVTRHVDLEGQEMPENGDSINASLCASARVLNTIHCCVFRDQVEIKHCRDLNVFIYKFQLESPAICPMTICAVPLSRPVDRRYMFLPGDRPHSTELATTTCPPETSTPGINKCQKLVDACGEGMQCVNTDSNYTCECPSGQILSHDGLSCLANLTFPEVTSLSTPNTTEMEQNSTWPGEASTTTPSVETTEATAETPVVSRNATVGAITTPPSTRFVEHSDDLKFSLQGTLREHQFLEAVKSQVVNAIWRPKLDQDRSVIPTLIDVERLDVFSLVTIRIINNATGEVVSSKDVLTLTDWSEFSETMSQATINLNLVRVCRGEACKSPRRQAQQSTLDELLPVFITIIVLLVICLLLFPLVKLCKYCSKRGTWIPYPDQERAEESADNLESKPTDPVNGDQPSLQDANGPNASKTEEDGGWWVVPLDQAPDSSDGKAKEIEDTPM